MVIKPKKSMLQKHKFYLLIGEEGTILVDMVGKKVVNRLFTPSHSKTDRQKIHTLLNDNPHAPIYILLDAMDQAYTRQTLPGVSALTIGKIVNKRLERDFPDSDLKGAILLGREEKGRKDWIYLFVSAAISPVIDEWIQYILTLPLKFAGIYLLPTETESLVHRLSRKIFKMKDMACEWQFLVTYNKTGGFRQIALQHGKIVFTRFIHPGKNSLPELLAGDLEQEIQNSLDYLRRLSFANEKGMDFFIIVSEDIKKNLADMNLKIPKGRKLIYTPHEVATFLEMKDITHPEDKFADILLCANFATSRHKLKLNTPNTQRIHHYVLAYQFGFICMGIIGAIFLLISAVSGMHTLSLKKKIQDIKEEKIAIEKQWKNAQSSEKYDIDDANKINDFVSLYKKVTTYIISPFPIMVTLAKVIHNQALVKSIHWTLDKIDDQLADKKPKLQIIFDITFYNTGKTIEELFSNFDNFTSSIKESFKAYTIDHSKLPETLTLSEQSNVISIQVSLSNIEKEKPSVPPGNAGATPPEDISIPVNEAK